MDSEQVPIDVNESLTQSQLKKLPAEKSKHIQVYFNPEQKKTLKKWLGVTRFIYNKCLAIIRETNNTTLKFLRSKVINNENYINENQWMLEYNYDLRDEALQDLLKNIKSNKAKKKLFKIHFKRRKDEYIKGASLSILAKHWNRKRGFYSDIFNNRIKTNEQLPEKMMYTSRLLKTATGKYYISLPLPLDENQINDKESSVLFIDPGSKVFLTGYDPSGKIIIFGKDDIGRIARLLHYKRKLQSKEMCKTINGKIKKRYRKAKLRIGEKITNLVNDMHKKLAKWLCSNYTRVYIPKLNFHNMKKLNKKEKSKLASLKHCNFVDRLKNKSREYNCKIIEVKEDYTSKTCSNCGYLKNDLKGRVYKCDSCEMVFDRDMNASKNIMLKYINEAKKRV
jgi:IS605 OrfB family transposase